MPTPSTTDLCLGIDPGLNRTGYALLLRTPDGPELREAGVIRSTAGKSLAQRVHEIGSGLREVIDDFRDVQAAGQDRETEINKAQAYRNEILPQARGEAANITQQAEAYKARVVANAEGEASRFKAVYEEYLLAEEVTKKRIYLETMEEVLQGVNKIIIDNEGGSGVVPYLPLPEVQKRRGASQ